MTKKEIRSKCQICGKMSVEIVQKNPKGVPKKELDADGYFYFWAHVVEPADHPPYPSFEWTKQEAQEDYERFKKGNF